VNVLCDSVFAIRRMANHTSMFRIGEIGNARLATTLRELKISASTLLNYALRQRGSDEIL
jgi:hypothetical protein